MTQNRYKDQFYRLKDNQYQIGNTSAKTRISKLKKLSHAVGNTYKQRIREALHSDFKKPQLEVDFTEIYPLIDEIKHVVKHLPFWLKEQKVGTPLALIGSSSYIKYEPKGTCLIISPWNFPINLTFIPLISAIAAGNTVMLKPSELTPHTTKVMATIIKEVFDEDEIVLIEGDVGTAIELLKLPFNHIFFTGSPEVGSKVMQAAAKNLASVTLELGGKSPTIVDSSANLKEAAEKTMFGKFINSGQTCIAPDYIMVHENAAEEFIAHCKTVLDNFYGSQPSRSQSYSAIVNEKHRLRITALIDDAREKGATLISPSKDITDNFNGKIPPILVTNSKEGMDLMKNEIFGPILPIKTYKHINEVTTYINANPKPLALYIFSQKGDIIDYLINNTRAGTTCINHNLVQFLNHNLPFGGSNNSGIGKSHGVFGFKEFSNARSILRQHTLSPTKFVLPPYNGFKQKIVDLLIKWF